MIKRVLVNREDTSIRVAFLEDAELVELHNEKLNDRTIVGNIYRGVVQDVVGGLQAAFIDVGGERNMFLHFMDIRPESLVFDEENLEEALVEASKEGLPGLRMRPGQRPRYDQRAANFETPVKKGDTIIVQVIKEGIGEKAPRVTANVSIPGRYLVLLPYPSQEGGVSRKIVQGPDRFRLKKLLQEIRGESSVSFIVRTAGIGMDDDAIRKDVENLTKTWDDLIARFRSLGKPGLVYSDQEIIPRLVRDAFPSDTDEIIVDSDSDKVALEETLAASMPHLKDRVFLFDSPESLFDKYQVSRQIERALKRKVWLKSGGYLIVEETEALTAIDVNSGRFIGKDDQEKTSLKINMEACEAIARELRVRDIGGIIVIDFIDMLSRENQRRVSDEFARHLKEDRAKTTVGTIGDLGLLQMTRKRQRGSLQKAVFDPCPYCDGEGWVLKTDEVWRRMKHELRSVFAENRDNLSAVIITCNPDMADALHRDLAAYLEAVNAVAQVKMIIRADADVHREDFTLTPMRRPTRDQLARIPSKRVEPEDVQRSPVAFQELESTPPRPEAPQGDPADRIADAEEVRRARREENRQEHLRDTAKVKLPAPLAPPIGKVIQQAQQQQKQQQQAQQQDQQAQAGQGGGRRRRGRRGGRGRGRGRGQVGAPGQPQVVDAMQSDAGAATVLPVQGESSPAQVIELGPLARVEPIAGSPGAASQTPAAPGGHDQQGGRRPRPPRPERKGGQQPAAAAIAPEPSRRPAPPAPATPPAVPAQPPAAVAQGLRLSKEALEAMNKPKSGIQIVYPFGGHRKPATPPAAPKQAPAAEVAPVVVAPATVEPPREIPAAVVEEPATLEVPQAVAAPEPVVASQQPPVEEETVASAAGGRKRRPSRTGGRRTTKAAAAPEAAKPSPTPAPARGTGARTKGSQQGGAAKGEQPKAGRGKPASKPAAKQAQAAPAPLRRAKGKVQKEGKPAVAAATPRKAAAPTPAAPATRGRSGAKQKPAPKGGQSSGRKSSKGNARS